MPAERPPPRSYPSIHPFQRRGSSFASASSSSSGSSSLASSPSVGTPYQPSPSSTLDSEYPVTPPSFGHYPLGGGPGQPGPSAANYARAHPTYPGQHTQRQHALPSHLNPSAGMNVSREPSVGYDPGGRGRERTGSSGSGTFGYPAGHHYGSSPSFLPQDLVICGPSMPFGFKAPLPLPLPLPLPSSSRAQPSAALVEPYFHSPMSPAPPFYPNYQGPPVFEDPSLPTPDEMQSWVEEASGGEPSSLRTRQMSPPVLYRSVTTTDCGRCKSHGVQCEWPGAEGVGACSNCFFSYSLCEPWTPSPRPNQNQPSGQSSVSDQTHEDGDRTPTQSPRSLPGATGSAPNRSLSSFSSASSSSSLFYPLPISTKAGQSSRPSPHIPISFLITEPSGSTVSAPLCDSPHQVGTTPSPSAFSSQPSPSSRSSGSAGSAKAAPDRLQSTTASGGSDSEGEMSEIFGRVVKLQASANANLGEVHETLKSPLPLSPMERNRQQMEEKMRSKEKGKDAGKEKLGHGLVSSDKDRDSLVAMEGVATAPGGGA